MVDSAEIKIRIHFGQKGSPVEKNRRRMRTFSKNRNCSGGIEAHGHVNLASFAYIVPPEKTVPFPLPRLRLPFPPCNEYSTIQFSLFFLETERGRESGGLSSALPTIYEPLFPSANQTCDDNWKMFIFIECTKRLLKKRFPLTSDICSNRFGVHVFFRSAFLLAGLQSMGYAVY